MVNSPVMNPDKFLDSSNPRYNDATNILEWLLENQDGGNYSYTELGDSIGVPPTTVREFLVPDVWAWRSYDYLLNLRENNYRAYMYYISNSREHNTERRGKMGCEINISKYPYMRFVAALHSCKLQYNDENNKRVALQMSESEAKRDVIPALREMDQDYHHLS